jgi:hypothetical protein
MRGGRGRLEEGVIMNETCKGSSCQKAFQSQVESLPTQYCRGHSSWIRVAVAMIWQATITLATSAKRLLYHAIVTPGWDGATATIIGGVEREEAIHRHQAWYQCPRII